MKQPHRESVQLTSPSPHPSKLTNEKETKIGWFSAGRQAEPSLTCHSAVIRAGAKNGVGDTSHSYTKLGIT